MFQTEIRVSFLQSHICYQFHLAFSLALSEVTYSIVAWIGFKSPTSHVKYLMHACWSRCFRSLSPCANGRNIVGY